MQQFNTGCYFNSREQLPKALRLDEDSSILFVDYGNCCEPMNCTIADGIIYGVEISASSKEKASYIVDILCACHTTVAGYNNENPEDIILKFNGDASNLLSQSGTSGVFYGDDSLMYACLMAQRVYGNQIFENAVCKYHVAHEVYSLHPMDLHPLEDPFQNEYLLSERIRISNVIIDCYSVLEELHVQIIANEKNPSVLKGGQWNPKVRSDLNFRLEAKHIDSGKTIPWLTRNGIVRPFKTSTVKHDNLCEWSDGTGICDFSINICDAILELSYMRSQLASHKLNSKILNLTVYDAENAFSLARHILLNYFKIDIFREATSPNT